MTPEALAARVQSALPGLRLREPWLRLGGNVNHVWRVAADPHDVIVKWAPPHVAAAPELALSSRRSALEAAALRLLGAGGELADVLGAHVRVPRVIAADPAQAWLVLEDFGPRRDLGEAVRERPELGTGLAELGAAIGALHARSALRPELAAAFDNRDVQRVREQVQYAAAGEWLRRAGCADHAALGARAAALGRSLLAPGRCLVMGDLWPPSLLVLGAARELALIDWEFVHWGRPLQDVAHLAAHLWMQGQRAPSPGAAAAFQGGLRAFLLAYAGEVERVPGLLDASELEAAGVHVGCEILMRTIGPFQAGYLYAGLAPAAPELQAALAAAAEHLRQPARAAALAPLRGRAQ